MDWLDLLVYLAPSLSKMRALYLPSLLCPQGWSGDQGSVCISQPLSRGRCRPVRPLQGGEPLPEPNQGLSARQQRLQTEPTWVAASCILLSLEKARFPAAPAKPVFCPESQALPCLSRNPLLRTPQFTPSCQWGPLPASVAHEPFPAELEKELSRRPRKVCIVKVVGTRNLWKNIVVLCVNS